MTDTKVGSKVWECVDNANRGRIAEMPVVVWRVHEKKLRSGETHTSAELVNGRILRSWILVR